MILIHAFPDGTFKTRTGITEPWGSHLRESSLYGLEGTRTYASEISPSEDDYQAFKEKMVRSYFDFVEPEFMPGRIKGDQDQGHEAWKHWAAHCMMRFGAWFTEVTGPTAGELLRERILRLVETRYEASGGVLINLVRPIPADVVRTELCTMVRDGSLAVRVSTNPRNHATVNIFRIRE